MNAHNLHPFLIASNGRCPFSLFGDSDDFDNCNFLILQLGVIQLEEIPNDKSHFLYKLLVARLRISGFRLKSLCELFPFTPNTIRSWVRILKSGDCEAIALTFGLQARSKLTPEVRSYVRFRYFDLTCIGIRNYRKQIIKELHDIFGISVSGETLRTIFRNLDLAEKDQLIDIPTTVDNSDNDETYDVENHDTRELDRLTDANNCDMAEDCSDTGLLSTSSDCDVATTTPNTNVSADSRGDETCIDIDVDHAPNKRPNSSFQTNNSTFRKTQPTCATDTEESCLTRKSFESFPLKTSRPALPLSGYAATQEVMLFHHLGMSLFFTQLNDFKNHLTEGRDICCQMVAQILQGAVNVEQGKLLNYDSLSKLIGPCFIDRRTVRTKLTDLSSPEFTQSLLKFNLSLVKNCGFKFFYYDPHGKDYTGLHPLLLAWCGRLKTTTKVLYSDYIHSSSGHPLFMKHFDNFYDLRERILMVITEFQQAFSAEECEGMTFIVDRGIFGLEAMNLFLLAKFHLVTWEKGYIKNGLNRKLPTHFFNITRLKNNSEDVRISSVEYQEDTWSKDERFRRIVIIITNHKGETANLSILCSNQDANVELVIELMLNRWLQENDFRWLRAHTGIDNIDSYATKNYQEIASQLSDRHVESREFYQKKKERTKLKSELNKLIVKKDKELAKIKNTHTKKITTKKNNRDQLLARLNDIPGTQSKNIHKIAIKAVALSKEIEELTLQQTHPKNGVGAELIKLIYDKEKQHTQINEKISTMLQTESRVEALIEQGYCILDTRKKEIIDMLRIIGRNIFYNLIDDFKTCYDNRRDDHVMLRTLTECSGKVKLIDGVMIIELWPKAEYQPATKTKIDAFLKIMESKLNQYFGKSNCHMLIELAKRK